MKQILQNILQVTLKFLAIRIIKKYQPQIIGITGSVGKTSAKEAICAVLSVHKKVRQNIKNYNNELGLPLTIIGAETAGKSLFGWLVVFLRSLNLIIIKADYPEILILEMGVDRPGDMKYLLQIAACDIGVITKIGESHLEYFGTIENIIMEKGLLAKKLPTSGWAILNNDDENVKKIALETKAQVITFGLSDGSMVRGDHINYKTANSSLGTSFDVIYKKEIKPIFLPDIIGVPAVLASLAGVAAGLAVGMSLDDAVDALHGVIWPLGRMRVLRGIKNTIIIDDTYNASPQSVIAALEALGQIDYQAKKIAVLGDMLELGSFTREGHLLVGRAVIKNKINDLIVVGEKATHIAFGAIENGMSKDNVFNLANNLEAGKFLQERMDEGDIILIKGSQGARMEKIVKEIMAEPLDAKKLLVRQDISWE